LNVRRSYCFLALALLSFNAFGQANYQANLYTANQSIDDSETPIGTIQGQLTTTDNQPAANVMVHLKGTTFNTMTDDNGNFILKNVKEGTYVLQVSMVGLQAQEKTITVTKDQTTSVSLSLVEDAKQLSIVVVSSGKSLNKRPVVIGKAPIDPMDLPQSIAVLGQGVIRDQQAQRLSDVIKNVNGIYLSTVRGSTQENFSGRGYAFGSSNLFKNGSRINSGTMPEMSSLERVEVLKGSAAILYGQVSPGGIVNMVTKQPKFKFGGEVSMRAGSYDLFKPSFDIYGPLTSSIAYRINGTFESANSFRDVVSSERYYVNPSLLFKLGNKTELVVEGDYLKHNFTPDFGIGTLGNGTIIPDVPRSRFLGAVWQYAKTQQSTATATVRHFFNENWQINTSLSYQNYYRDYFSTERINPTTTDGEWTRPLGRTNTEENYYTGQVNLTGKFKTRSLEHTLLAGIDADRYVTTNFNYSIAGGTNYDKINILDPSKYTQRTDIPATEKIRKIEAPVDRSGFYVQDLIKLSDKFNVLAGIRWSSVYSDNPDSTLLKTNTKTQAKSQYDNAFSPRFGIVYKPTTTTSVFASYANSFNVNSGTDIYGQALDPSIIDQYELGIKNDFFNGKLSANVTLYQIKNNNLAQTAQFTLTGEQNSNSAIKALVGETTSKGIEIDLAGHPTVGLDLMAGYSYNDMRYSKVPVAVGNFVEGQRLVNTPAHTANGSVFYTFQESSLKGLKVGLSAFYVGERNSGWNSDYQSAPDPNDASKRILVVRDRLIPVDGFTTLDFTAGYTYKKFSFLAKVSNLTNTYNYYLHENYSVNPIPPTQLVGTVSYKF
jgi:iron complex outermembrane receptor protein